MSSSESGFSNFMHTVSSFVPSSSPSQPSEEHHQQGIQQGNKLEHGGGSAGRKPPSGGDLLSDAKVIMDAAMAKLHKTEAESQEGNKFDNAKVATAAAEMLEAAKHYGKMDENNYGKYVDKAEDYLKKYGAQGPGKDQGHMQAPHRPSQSSTPPSSHSSEEQEENKYGDYLKKAGDFLKRY